MGKGGDAIPARGQQPGGRDRSRRAHPRQRRLPDPGRGDRPAIRLRCLAVRQRAGLCRPGRRAGGVIAAQCRRRSILAVGDVIEIGDLALTVHGVTFPAGDEFNRPDEGQRFVVVDVAVENRTATAQNISSLLQMELKDATGQVYDLDLMAQAASGGTSRWRTGPRRNPARSGRLSGSQRRDRPGLRFRRRHLRRGQGVCGPAEE
ncbi:MAG: DUF4352 domain-containing protein [Candidatus Promineofilum sp.]|nr:DUF4352 domain-containing protein [Promineifilum sp.]